MMDNVFNDISLEVLLLGHLKTSGDLLRSTFQGSHGLEKALNLGGFP